MKNYILMYVCVLLHTACASDQKYEEDTEFLTSYLSSTFNLSIPTEKHYFLFVPETGCKGCVAYASDPDLNYEYADNVTLIYLVQDKSSLESESYQGKPYTGTIHQAYTNDIYAFNMTLFQTSNERIDTIYDINANNIVEVFNETVVSKTH